MATKSRKREREKENCYANECIDGANGKVGGWTITQDVVRDPPLLADMGLSILQEDQSLNNGEPTPTPPNTEAKLSHCPRTTKVLVAKNQNISEENGVVSDMPVNDAEFFVYKRRRLEPIGGEDKFNRMIDEVILMIFKWLPKYMLARCAQVCRRWKRLAFDESLWRRLDLGGKSLKPGVVGRVILRGTNSLRLSKAEISSPIFSPQLHHLPESQRASIRSRLTYLDVGLAAVSEEGLEEIFEVCSELQKVNLEHCNLSYDICNHISQNFHIDTLNLTMCYNLDAKSLKPILSSCNRLQSLNLGWTGLTKDDLNMICDKFPRSLLRLNISGCRYSLQDRHVVSICRQCPALLELDLSDCTQLTSDSVVYITQCLDNVEYLAFARCYCIQPDAYLTLKHLPRLLFLDVYGVLNDTALVTLQQSLPNIQINKYLFSSVARPTVGIRRTSIWGRRVRD